MFLFAGHDTTSSALCFAYYLLSRNPSAKHLVRAELDRVLGPDVTEFPSLIARMPSLLNRLPYTTAVIKETLRLYPPSSTLRQGSPAFHLRDPRTCALYPTADLVVCGSSPASMRDPAAFPRPHDFVPERLLADADQTLRVRKNHWRPFELGPRNCIGQEFAMLELRLALALTVREFDVLPQYPANGPTFMGKQCYQVNRSEDVTPHTKGRLPARIAQRMVF